MLRLTHCSLRRCLKTHKFKELSVDRARFTVVAGETQRFNTIHESTAKEPNPDIDIVKRIHHQLFRRESVPELVSLISDEKNWKNWLQFAIPYTHEKVQAEMARKDAVSNEISSESNSAASRRDKKKKSMRETKASASPDAAVMHVPMSPPYVDDTPFASMLSPSILFELPLERQRELWSLTCSDPLLLRSVGVIRLLRLAFEDDALLQPLQTPQPRIRAQRTHASKIQGKSGSNADTDRSISMADSASLPPTQQLRIDKITAKFIVTHMTSWLTSVKGLEKQTLWYQLISTLRWKLNVPFHDLVDLFKDQVIDLDRRLVEENSRNVDDWETFGEIAIATHLALRPVFPLRESENPSLMFGAIQELYSKSLLRAAVFNITSYKDLVSSSLRFVYSGEDEMRGKPQGDAEVSRFQKALEKFMEGSFRLIRGNDYSAILRREMFFARINDLDLTRHFFTYLYRPPPYQSLLVGSQGYMHIIKTILNHGQFSDALSVLNAVGPVLDACTYEKLSEEGARAYKDAPDLIVMKNDKDVPNSGSLTNRGVRLGVTIHHYVLIRKKVSLGLLDRHALTIFLFKRSQMKDAFLPDMEFLVDVTKSAMFRFDYDVMHEVTRCSREAIFIKPRPRISKKYAQKNPDHAAAGETWSPTGNNVQPHTSWNEDKGFRTTIRHVTQEEMLENTAAAGHKMDLKLIYSSAIKLVLDPRVHVHGTLKPAFIAKRHLDFMVDAKLDPEPQLFFLVMDAMVRIGQNEEVIQMYRTASELGVKRDWKHAACLIKSFVGLGRLIEAYSTLYLLHNTESAVNNTLYVDILERLLVELADGSVSSGGKRSFNAEELRESCITLYTIILNWDNEKGEPAGSPLALSINRLIERTACALYKYSLNAPQDEADALMSTLRAIPCKYSARMFIYYSKLSEDR